MLKHSILLLYCFPNFAEQYDNGVNNVVPTLITMIPDVESSFSKICKLELDGKLEYQKQLQPPEASASTAPVSVYIYVFLQFKFFPSKCLWSCHFANPLLVVLLTITVFP